MKNKKIILISILLIFYILPTSIYSQTEVGSTGGNGSLSPEELIFLDTPLPQSFIYKNTQNWTWDIYDGNFGPWYYFDLSYQTKVTFKSEFSGINGFGTFIVLSGDNWEMLNDRFESSIVLDLPAGSYIFLAAPIPTPYKNKLISDYDFFDLPIKEFGKLNVTIGGNLNDDPVEPSIPIPTTGPIVEYSFDSSGNIATRKVRILTGSRTKSTLSLPYFAKKEPDFTLDTTSEIKIYPNPTKGQLKIEIPDFDSNEEVTIRAYNMKGVLILNAKKSESLINLDFSNYSNGMYILQMQRAGKTTSWKILKTN